MIPQSNATGEKLTIGFLASYFSHRLKKRILAWYPGDHNIMMWK
jgi:hypothetical protein